MKGFLKIYFQPKKSADELKFTNYSLLNVPAKQSVLKTLCDPLTC